MHSRRNKAAAAGLGLHRAYLNEWFHISIEMKNKSSGLETGLRSTKQGTFRKETVAVVRGMMQKMQSDGVP